MREDDARAVLGERRFDERPEGEPWPALELRVIAIGLEALEPALRDRVAVLCERSGYLSAVLSRLVGEHGHVLAMRHEHEGEGVGLAGLANVEVRAADPQQPLRLAGAFDGVWIGAAIPRVPAGLLEHLHDGGGRAIAFVGPRFRPQDLVSLTWHGDELTERRVARLRVPVLAGAGGWLRSPPVGPARAAE